MKLAINSILLLLLTVIALAAEKPRQVIISYPDKTPDTISCLEEAKKVILEAGGVITHEYNLIVGFAAKMPAQAAKVLETIKTAGAEHNVLIEEDQTISINN